MKNFTLFLFFYLFLISINAQNSNSFLFNIEELPKIPISNTEDYLRQRFINSNLSVFKNVKETTDNLNTTHATYQQLYNEIPIEGCVVLVHSKNGNIYCVNGQVIDNSKLPSSTKVLITKQNARNSAQQKAKTINTSDKPTENVIVKVNKNGTFYYRLAIKVRVESINPMKVSDVYIDAETGEVLNEISLINNIDVAGTAQTMYKGIQNITCDKTDNTYYLIDNQRNIKTYDASSLPNEPIIYTRNISYWYTSVLTSVTISSVSTSWWSSITDTKPDLYIIIKDNKGNQLYKSSYIENTFPPITFTLPTPIVLNSIGYSIEIWDYNTLLSDSYGGSVTISNINKGNYSWSNTNQSGSIVISDYPHPSLDVHWGMEKTYDFYLTKFGRKSYDGNGAQIIQYVNPPTVLFKGEYPNQAAAYYQANPFFMAYGMGDGTFMRPVVALDVMAHEFTHLVTFSSVLSGLEYKGESGALNESFSDIFACGVEFFANINPNWTIGEDVMIPAPFMRSMSDPKTSLLNFSCKSPYTNNDTIFDKRQPNTYQKGPWANTSDISNDYGGVHINSGVQNFWFYLLSQGGSGTNDLGKSYSESGIGIDDALKIVYRNLTTYIISQSSYKDACNGSLQAAKDLFTATNSTQYQAVKSAWEAVGVYAQPLVLITQVYGGGGNSGATYKSDFIELYNTTNSDINIGGWCLYYIAATSSSTTLKYEIPANSIIKANSYFLVKGGEGTGTQPAWNITFDGTCTLNLSGSTGKVILLKSNSAFTLSTPPTIDEIINNVDFMDYVPFGTTAIPVWGTAMSANTTSTTSARRKFVNGQYQCTKDIGNDFEIVTANPRNSSMTVDVKTINNDNSSVFAYEKTLFLTGVALNQLVEVYNITGSKVFSSKINYNSIPLTNLSSGIYIVRVGVKTYKVKL
jgi:Zn-dependent metalloprotease